MGRYGAQVQILPSSQNKILVVIYVNKFDVGDRVRLKLDAFVEGHSDNGAYGTVVDVDKNLSGAASYGIQLDAPLKKPSSFFAELNDENTFFRCISKWIMPVIEESDIDISALV